MSTKRSKDSLTFFSSSSYCFSFYFFKSHSFRRPNASGNGWWSGRQEPTFPSGSSPSSYYYSIPSSSIHSSFLCFSLVSSATYMCTDKLTYMYCIQLYMCMYACATTVYSVLPNVSRAVLLVAIRSVHVKSGRKFPSETKQHLSHILSVEQADSFALWLVGSTQLATVSPKHNNKYIILYIALHSNAFYICIYNIHI